MKTIDKFLIGLVLSAGFFCFLATHANAAAYARAPKVCKTFAYTTTFSSVTTETIAQSTNSVTVPGAVYSVYLGTGAAGDYLVLLDTNTASGLTNTGGGVTNASQIGPRLFYSSSTANTVIIFDPPIIFYNGLMTQMSAGTNQETICYETGRALTGS